MRIKNNVVDWIINALTLVLIAGTGIFLAGKWNSMPSRIAMHFDMAGNPDGYGGKGVTIVLFVVMLAAFAGMTLAEYFPNLWSFPVQITDNNRYVIYRIAKYLLEVVKLLLVGTFAFILIAQILGKGLPGWFLPVELVLLLGTTTIGMIVMVRKGKR